MGFQQSSEDMLNAYLFCDYVVLPYIECGEMASAAAGNALELNSNVFEYMKILSTLLIWEIIWN